MHFNEGATAMKPATAPSALKVQAALGPDFQVLELEASTRTAQEAATAIGCTVPLLQLSAARPPQATASDPPLRD
jgi:hypothetical protein